MPFSFALIPVSGEKGNRKMCVFICTVAQDGKKAFPVCIQTVKDAVRVNNVQMNILGKLGQAVMQCIQIIAVVFRKRKLSHQIPVQHLL